MICLNVLPKLLYRPIILGIVLALTAMSAAAQKNDETEADAQQKAQAAEQKLKDAAQKGIPLPNASSTDVTNNTSVEATLIPASIAKTVFGKEIANHYAVISLTISDQSSDYAFIVHSIFIDYSQWLLGGTSPFIETNTLCSQGQKAATFSAVSKNSKDAGSSLKTNQGTDASSSVSRSLPS